MSHHYRAKGGTAFNFNSDLSGDVHLVLPNAGDVHVEEGPRELGYPFGSPPKAFAKVSAADLLEFVDWWRKTEGYGKAEEEDDEPPHPGTLETP